MMNHKKLSPYDSINYIKYEYKAMLQSSTIESMLENDQLTKEEVCDFLRRINKDLLERNENGDHKDIVNIILNPSLLGSIYNAKDPSIDDDAICIELLNVLHNQLDLLKQKINVKQLDELDIDFITMKAKLLKFKFKTTDQKYIPAITLRYPNFGQQYITNVKSITPLGQNKNNNRRFLITYDQNFVNKEGLKNIINFSLDVNILSESENIVNGLEIDIPANPQAFFNKITKEPFTTNKNQWSKNELNYIEYYCEKVCLFSDSDTKHQAWILQNILDFCLYKPNYYCKNFPKQRIKAESQNNVNLVMKREYINNTTKSNLDSTLSLDDFIIGVKSLSNREMESRYSEYKITFSHLNKDLLKIVRSIDSSCTEVTTNNNNNKEMTIKLENIKQNPSQGASAIMSNKEILYSIYQASMNNQEKDLLSQIKILFDSKILKIQENIHL